MQLDNLRQPCNNSTLMGVMRGAADYFGLDVTTPMLYGLSGHAFLINIHTALCPSGPYCWNREPFFRLLRNLGIETTELGFFWKEGGACPRAEVEQRLREALDSGLPCFLVNMEYQLLTGYDETGFLTAQPWAPHMDFPPKHLTFGTWEELGQEIHIDFHILRSVPPLDRPRAVRESLSYARDLWRNPASHTSEDYGVGPSAYRNWIQAVRDGHGPSHGNWWNGTVWAECRQNASAYMAELDGILPQAAELAPKYARVAALLGQASDKELGDAEKIEALTEAAELDHACAERL
ncbi:MAG: hypothetical protein HYU66_21000 [Armatimonadetes bacterium]|nr:hypothetical protein [Armatimonadota bacterium]